MLKKILYSFLASTVSEPNSATHRDSCVEFFIDPMKDGNYYNFEFNCIGTTHLAYGPDRSNRTFIPQEKIIKEIKTLQQNLLFLRTIGTTSSAQPMPQTSIPSLL